ncbi:hypothetical protein GCM10007148_10000 [Parvularcula lutaonensis]|nr:hypothetical protein GCM10007148_10000 [Parvularcula lutaonensis]
MSDPELRQTYDAQASGWNRALGTLGTEAAYRALCAAFTRDLTAPVPGQPLQVLDAGAGTGAFSSAFLREAVERVELHALDTSRHMLVEAQRRYREMGTEARLHLGDVRRLPFTDGTLDVVLMAHVLEHLAEPRDVLAEMFRVLRPGGRILIAATRASAASLPIQVFWKTHGFEANRFAAWLSEAGASDVERIEPAGMPLFNQISLAFAARKPLRLPETDDFRGNDHAT